MSAGVATGVWAAPTLADQEAQRTEAGTGIHCDPKCCPLRPTSFSKAPPLKGPTTCTNINTRRRWSIWTHKPMEAPSPHFPRSLMFYFSCSQDTLGHWVIMAAVCSVLQPLPDGQRGPWVEEPCLLFCACTGPHCDARFIVNTQQMFAQSWFAAHTCYLSDRCVLCAVRGETCPCI